MKKEKHYPEYPPVRYGDMEFGSLKEFTDWHRTQMKIRYGDDYFEKEEKRRQYNIKVEKVFDVIMYCILGAFMLFMVFGLIKVLIYGHG